MPRDGALAVTRTRDGGKTWETLRDGLPQRDAFDLIYRHGLDVDATGSRLAMGSTTGALWVERRRRRGWQLVNAHLPPIYAVRLDLADLGLILRSIAKRCVSMYAQQLRSLPSFETPGFVRSRMSAALRQKRRGDSTRRFV